jgi:glucose-6-phosphate isomerase
MTVVSNQRIEPLRLEVPPNFASAVTAGLCDAHREMLAESARAEPADYQSSPRRMLDEHRQVRRASELTRILRLAKRIRDAVDRVVIVGGQNALAPMNAIFTACREPFFNEWTRAERGGRPRIYFLSEGLDNDRLSMLMKLVAGDSWALVGAAPHAPADEFRAPWNVLLRCGRPAIRCLLAGEGEWDVSDIAAGCEVLTGGQLWPGDASPFSFASLVAGSIMGIDIVRLLEGAAHMQQQFENEPPATSAALTLAAFSHSSQDTRLVLWSSAMVGVGQWRNRMSPEWRWECFPDTLLDTCSAAVSITVDSWRCDAVEAGLPEESVPVLAERRAAAWLAERRAAALPVASLRLPGHDEASLGQLFQLLLLAANAERRTLS